MSLSHRVRLLWRTGRERDSRVGAAEGSEETVLTVDEGETVLDAAERQGIGLPVGCRTGACATCTGRLLAGEVMHVRPPRALKPRHLDEGYVLLCLAVPQVDCTVEVGTAVSRDLVTNPWR